MSIGLKGLYTPELPETRDIAYLEVEYNGNVYDWLAFVPRDVDLSTYLPTIEQSIYNDIARKEAAWAALDPKTRTIVDPITDEETIVPIEKSEIVKADNPDYFALRRAAYPPIGDQLDAFWKGPVSEAYAALQQKIIEVKEKYPKPIN